ncbi:MAG: ATP-binding cassette domain-containing protein [Dehalococcoidales bacterium]|jgi:phosphonate transport system ATP-binding protein
MMDSIDNSGSAFVLDAVTKAYPETVALAPLSLTIARGERIALVGPSGAGKTTLLNLLGGVTQPDQGRIWIHGQPLAGFKPGRELASLVGIIHQQFDLVPSLAVVHNVLAGRLGRWSLARSLVSLVSPRERYRALQALESVGIADKVYERTSRLSGGEQQRVAVARLLVQDPRIILADEPVASLDPARAQDMLGLLSDITTERGETLVASLHVVDLVRRCFSRVIGLRSGELQFDIPAGELTEEILERLYEIKGVVACADVR